MTTLYSKYCYNEVCYKGTVLYYSDTRIQCRRLFELPRDKTCLRGFQESEVQTSLFCELQ